MSIQPIQTQNGTYFVAGPYITFTHEEVKQRLLARADYHERRAKYKEDEILPGLKKALEALKMDPRANHHNMYNSNPVDSFQRMEQDIKNHRNKAALFRAIEKQIIKHPYVMNVTEACGWELLSEQNQESEEESWA